MSESAPRAGASRPCGCSARRSATGWSRAFPARSPTSPRHAERFRPNVIVADASMWGPALVMREAQGIAVALLSPLIYAVLPGRDIPPLGLASRRPAHAPHAGAGEGGASDRLAARPPGAPARSTSCARTTGFRRSKARSTRCWAGCRCTWWRASPSSTSTAHDLPPGVRYVGPLLWHPPDPPGTAEWLDTLPADRPWVHVTEGTSHYQDPFLLRAAAAGPGRGALRGDPDHGPPPGGRDLGRRRRNVHVHDWLAHGALLPRCSALVTTGGAGTTMAGLRAGLPLVLVPTSWDKPDIALRMVEAGVAVRVAPRRCTPEALRRRSTRCWAIHATARMRGADRGEACCCARAGRRGGPHRGAGERRAAGAGHCSAGGRR